MEHYCLSCGEMWMNNARAGRCPGCASDQVRSAFDEEIGDLDDRDDYEREDN